MGWGGGTFDIKALDHFCGSMFVSTTPLQRIIIDFKYFHYIKEQHAIGVHPGTIRIPAGHTRFLRDGDLAEGRVHRGRRRVPLGHTEENGRAGVPGDTYP